MKDMRINKNYWIISTVLFLIVYACTFEQPTLPNWFVDWKIPIPETGFTMKEAAEDPNVVVDSTDIVNPILAISITDSLEKESVSAADLAIKADSESSGANIENISLGTQGPVSTDTISVETLLGVPLVAGITIDIPEGDVTPPDRMLVFDDYISVNVKSGQLQLNFVNNTFVNIRSGMVITVYDEVNATELGTVNFNAIDAGNAGTSDQLSLTEIDLSNQLRLQFQIPVAGEQGHLLTEDDVNGSVHIEGTIFNLKITAGEAKLPANQEITLEDSTSIEDQQHRVRTAIIDRGNFDVLIINKLPVGADVAITLPNLIDIDTQAEFTDIFEINAQTEERFTISVQNLKLTDYPDPNSGEIINYLHYDVQVLTKASGGPVTISENDSLLVTVFPDSIFFSEVDGRLDRIDLDIDPVEESDLVDFSQVEGSITLDSLKLVLSMYNETGFEINLSILISGRNDQEEITLAPIDIKIPAGSVEFPGTETVELTGNSQSPTIVDLLEILPSVIRMEGQGFIEGDGTVSLNQGVWANYEIYSPFYLWIREQSFVTSEIETVNLEDDVRENIEKNVEQAIVFFDIYNGLPIGASASLYVSVDSTALFDDEIPDSTKKFVIDNVIITGGELDLDGYVQTAWTGDETRKLDQQKIQVLTNDPVYIGTRITLDETEGLVKFRPNDMISVNGFFQIKFLMNNDE